MAGLFLALLYIGWSVLQNNTTLEIACASSLNFLWYWYISTTILAACMISLIGIFGFFGLTLKDNKQAKDALAKAPIWAIVLTIKSSLLLTGIAILISAQAGNTFAEWNISKLIIGGIIYIVGLLSFSHVNLESK